MRSARALLLLTGSAAVALCGCSHRTYYIPPPPPPPPPQAYREVPPLIRLAQENGFHFGQNAGARDIASTGYHPRADRAFHDTPGYDANLGPYQPYRDAFRAAFLRGYNGYFNR